MSIYINQNAEQNIFIFRVRKQNMLSKYQSEDLEIISFKNILWHSINDHHHHQNIISEQKPCITPVVGLCNLRITKQNINHSVTKVCTQNRDHYYNPWQGRIHYYNPWLGRIHYYYPWLGRIHYYNPWQGRTEQNGNRNKFRIKESCQMFSEITFYPNKVLNKIILSS